MSFGPEPLFQTYVLEAVVFDHRFETESSETNRSASNNKMMFRFAFCFSGFAEWFNKMGTLLLLVPNVPQPNPAFQKHTGNGGGKMMAA